jgi:hypothetical protein
MKHLRKHNNRIVGFGVTESINQGRKNLTQTTLMYTQHIRVTIIISNGFHETENKAQFLYYRSWNIAEISGNLLLTSSIFIQIKLNCSFCLSLWKVLLLKLKKIGFWPRFLSFHNAMTNINSHLLFSCSN